jgi:anion-transporting  ArsA/GET3 family ATPase
VRIILYTRKGGVGKTTVAAATALKAAGGRVEGDKLKVRLQDGNA